MKASEIKRNHIVDIAGVPHVVEQVQVQTPSARGGSTIYKVRYRNVKTQQKVDQTYRGDDVVQEMDFDKRLCQYLYQSGDQYTFMDLEDYSQFDVLEHDLGDALLFLKEDMEGIRALVSGGQVLAVEMPDVVELEIIECDPSMKGASATARTKPAQLETGLTVQVPEYIAPGDVVRVDTRTREFLARA